MAKKSRKAQGEPRKAVVFRSKRETLLFASKGHEVSSWRFLRTGAQRRFYAPSQGSGTGTFT